MVTNCYKYFSDDDTVSGSHAKHMSPQSVSSFTQVNIFSK